MKEKDLKKDIEAAKNMTKEELEKILDSCRAVIYLQEKMQNSYFWTPPKRARDRRSYEKYYSQFFDFEFLGDKYDFNQETSCTCKNIYFSSRFWINNEKKDIRLVKKLAARVEAILNYRCSLTSSSEID